MSNNESSSDIIRIRRITVGIPIVIIITKLLKPIIVVLILYDISVRIRGHIGPRALKHQDSSAYNPETCIPKNQEA